MALEVSNEKELLMILIALENTTEVLESDERFTSCYQDIYVRLFNRVVNEYNEIADFQEAVLLATILDE